MSIERDKLKKAIQEGKIKDKTTLSVFLMNEELRKELETKISELINKVDGAVKEVKDSEVNLDKVLESVKGSQGEKGDAGVDGLTPTEEELLALIKPLIPVVENGHTPTNEELLAIIKPLIPKAIPGKDGETPIKGLDYFDGADGKDGSPDTRLQIIEKINSGGSKDLKIALAQIEERTNFLGGYTIDRALSILDERTQFLINKTTSNTSVNGITGAVTIAAGSGITVSTVGSTITISKTSDTDDWNLTGNSGTTAGTNFLGTTDNVALVFKTNAIERLRIATSADSTQTTFTLNGSSDNIFTTPGRFLTFQSIGGTYGTIKLILANEGGQNGPTFVQAGTVGVLDAGFLVASSDIAPTTYLRTYRLEARGGFTRLGSVPESQWGVAGGPTFVYNDNQFNFVYPITGNTYFSDQLLGDTNNSPYQVFIKGKQGTNVNSTSFGTPVQSVVQGDYCYAINTTSIQAFSGEVGSLTALGSPVSTIVQAWRIDVKGNYAYVLENDSDGTQRLEVFDISNPTVIVSVGNVDLGSVGQPDNTNYDIKVKGQLAYVGANTSLLKIVDISLPTAPKIIFDGDVTTDGEPLTRLNAQGNTLFYASKTSNIVGAINIKNPLAPTNISGITTATGNPIDIDVQGDYMYVVEDDGDGGYHFVTYSIANPASIVDVSNDDGNHTTINDQPHCVRVQGRYAYIGAGSQFECYDISGTFPTFVWTVDPDNGTIRSVYPQGVWLYFVHDNVGSGTISGAYIQQLEAGGMTVGTLNVRNTIQALDGDFKGGLNTKNLNVSDRGDFGSIQTTGLIQQYFTTGQQYNTLGTTDGTNGEGFEYSYDFGGGGIARLTAINHGTAYTHMIFEALDVEIKTGSGSLSNAMTLAGGLVSKYHNISTAGWGIPAIYANSRATGQTSRSAAVATITVGSADGSFLVSGNVLVTASTTHSFSLDVTYTDESNTSRTLILPMAQLAGSFISGGLITNVTGVGTYESAVMQIRCKASTTITIRPSAGTFTSVTYNAEGTIQQIA